MAAESILTHLKPDHPKKGVNGGTYDTRLEYIGPYDDLEAASPSIGDAWGDYEGLADSVTLEPITGTDPLLGILGINMVRSFESSGGGGGTGTATDITYEVEWTVISRPLAEHPKFLPTGFWQLDATDFEKIAKWENEKTAANRTALSANASRYADGIDLGIRTYDDYAPVLTKTTTYVNGPPPTSEAGSMDDPPAGFPNKPTGYEWIKSADRSLKAGKKNKWERSEQWLGAIKVLVDKDSLYY